MVLDDVAALLAEAGLGTPGTDLFLARSPDSPDTVTVIREYGGMAPDYLYGVPDPTEEWNSVQIECRDADYAAARLRIERCARALGAVRDRVVNGTHYYRISPLGPPVPLGEDESQRSRIVCSLEAAKVPSPLAV